MSATAAAFAESSHIVEKTSWKRRPLRASKHRRPRMSGRGVVRREVIEDHGQIMLHFLLVCGDSSRPGSPFPRPRHRITTYDSANATVLSMQFGGSTRGWR